jgi:hypothetical protein
MTGVAQRYPSKHQAANHCPKLILTVIWGFGRFHLVVLMTEQPSDNAHFFIGTIFRPLLLARFPDRQKPHFTPPNLYLDDRRVHFSKASDALCTENDIVRVPHPSYSPDLAP